MTVPGGGRGGGRGGVGGESELELLAILCSPAAHIFNDSIACALYASEEESFEKNMVLSSSFPDMAFPPAPPSASGDLWHVCHGVDGSLLQEVVGVGGDRGVGGEEGCVMREGTGWCPSGVCCRGVSCGGMCVCCCCCGC